MTVAEFGGRWIRGLEGRVAPTTIRAYRGACVRSILPRFGEAPLEALTTPIIRGWLFDRLEMGAARNTISGELTALSALLTEAMLQGLVTGNAAHGAARKIWKPSAVRAPKALSREQLQVLTHAADLDGSRWLAAWVRIGSRTGLRPGEQLALEPRDLTPQGLRVERTYHGTGRFGPPKGGRSRVVEVSHGTSGLLMLRASLETGGGGVAPVSRFLFPGRHPGRPLDPASMERAFGRAVARAGLPAHFTPHCLRHTYASLLLSAGAPPQYVRQQMGHASIKLTVDVYGSWLAGSRPDLLALLDDEPSRHPPQPARHHGIGKILAFTRPHCRRA